MLRRRAFNKTSTLKIEYKSLTEDKIEIKDLAVSFYKNLLTKNM